MTDAPSLSLTVGENPAQSEAYDLIPCQLEYVFDLCPAWLALFQVEDVFWQDHTADESGYTMALATDIPTALMNLRERSLLLSEAFGQGWDQSVSLFEAFFACPGATHVLYELHYNLETYNDVLDARQKVTDAIRSFDIRYVTGRTSFFTKRPEVPKELRWLRDYLKQFSKRPDGNRAWVIFGAGVGCEYRRVNFDSN